MGGGVRGAWRLLYKTGETPKKGGKKGGSDLLERKARGLLKFGKPDFVLGGDRRDLRRGRFVPRRRWGKEGESDRTSGKGRTVKTKTCTQSRKE